MICTLKICLVIQWGIKLCVSCLGHKKCSQGSPFTIDLCYKWCMCIRERPSLPCNMWDRRTLCHPSTGGNVMSPKKSRLSFRHAVSQHHLNQEWTHFFGLWITFKMTKAKLCMFTINDGLQFILINYLLQRLSVLNVMHSNQINWEINEKKNLWAGVFKVYAYMCISKLIH